MNGLVEAATYCKPGDEKRPSLVGLPDFTTTTLCPEDVSQDVPMATDASPDTFYVRIMFDELLDPSVEDLDPILDENDLETGSFTGTIARTKPVTLRCTGVDGQLHDIEYDGYYSPSGNSVTWPVGPSLVIKQVGDVIVPTNSACEVTIKDFVKDKSGEPIPTEQRGPFRFQVSGIKPLVIDPSDESEVTADAVFFGNFYTQFNAPVAVTPDAFTITPDEKACLNTARACTTDAQCDATDPDDTCEGGVYSYRISASEFGYGPVGYPKPGASYTFALDAGAKLEDQCGIETTLGAPDVDALTKTTVKILPFGPDAAAPFTINDGDVVPANRKMKLQFNSPLLAVGSFLIPAFVPDFVADSLFTITPAPMANATTPLTPQQMIRFTRQFDRRNDIFIAGHYQPNTEYTFTLKNGATITDNYGNEFKQQGDKVIKFKTQPIAVTASSPANGATVVKAAPGSVSVVSFTFNQSMNPLTWEADDIVLTGPTTNFTMCANNAALDPATGAPQLCCPAGMTQTCGTALVGSCGITSTSCSMQIRGVFAPGDYEVKLKAGAVVKDMLNNDYTQAADRVIKFTVEEAEPEPVIPCLGS